MGRPRNDSSQGLPARVYLKSGSFYYVHATGQRWERLGRDLDAARKIADAYNAGSSTYGTMAYWLDAWLKTLARRVEVKDLAPRTFSDYKNAAEPLKAFFGSMAPRAIEAPHVREYLDIGVAEERPIRATGRKPPCPAASAG